MSLTFDTFTPRQTMEDGLFECHHYLDRVPPQVEYHEHEFYEIFFFLSGMSPTSSREAPISCGRGTSSSPATRTSTSQRSGRGNPMSAM